MTKKTKPKKAVKVSATGRKAFAVLAPEIVAAFVKITETWGAKTYPPVDKTRNPVAARAEAYISIGKPFGCNTSAVAGLVSVLLGEPIRVYKADRRIEPVTGIVVVATKRAGTVAAGTTLVCVDREGYWRSTSDRFGGDFEYSQIRPATPKEVDRFIRKMLQLRPVETTGLIA